MGMKNLSNEAALNDEELIKALRGWMTSTSFDDDVHAAADRIEQLVKENHQLATALAGCNIAWDQALHQRDEAKAKLAKAVEVLRNRMHCHDCSCGECDHIRDTLAELEKDT